ncbi:MAG: sugar phosphate nucleotidyltransferase [bacterium]|nr:sugar phosphate nucleotidyltransferase [bacterium]
MQAIILAAGNCSRFWPLAQDRHKSMYEIGDGKPILAYTIAGLQKAGIDDLVVVVGEKERAIQEFFSDGKKWQVKIQYVVQLKPLGMGEAILRAREFLQPARNFLVLNASQVAAGELVNAQRRALKLLDRQVVLFGQKTLTPWNFGIMQIDQFNVSKIVEKPENYIGDTRILGVYALPYWFLEALEHFDQEYSFESALSSVLKKNGGVRGIILPENISLPSLKYSWDLLAMNRWAMDRWQNRNIEMSGDVEIHPSAFIYGPVVIEKGAKILENAVVRGPCYIGEGSIIGTHSVVRDHCYVGRGVMVGALSEVKNSLLYDGVSLHRNFIGDSILDRDCHIGAGTIAANKKFKRGKKEVHPHRSTVRGKKIDTGLTGLGVIIGMNSEVGINVTIFPAVKIGREAEVRPGVILPEDVPDCHISRSADINTNCERRSV